MTRSARLSLAVVEQGLLAMHGPSPGLPFSTLFEAVVWECCAYLVDDDRRAAVYAFLRKDVGIDPARILAAPDRQLQSALADGGMFPAARVQKLRDAAMVALEIGLSELERLVREAPKKARPLLKRFPQIGDPGADWLLLLGGGRHSLAPESNALRVLLRLGFGTESGSYSRDYRSVQAAVAPELPVRTGEVIELRQLLRRHGQAICTRTKPRCEVCALARSCAYSAR